MSTEPFHISLLGSICKGTEHRRCSISWTDNTVDLAHTSNLPHNWNKAKKRAHIVETCSSMEIQGKQRSSSLPMVNQSGWSSSALRSKCQNNSDVIVPSDWMQTDSCTLSYGFIQMNQVFTKTRFLSRQENSQYALHKWWISQPCTIFRARVVSFNHSSDGRVDRRCKLKARIRSGRKIGTTSWWDRNLS